MGWGLWGEGKGRTGMENEYGGRGGKVGVAVIMGLVMNS